MMKDGEISLVDLWEKLKDGWRYVLGGAVLGLAGAGVALMVLPPKYEAEAVVQVAQIGSGPVEAPAQAIERIKTATFQMVVAKHTGNQRWIDDLRSSTAATEKYLNAQLIKTSPNLIEVKAFGYSAENAKNTAEATVLGLAARQAEIAKPMIDKMRMDLLIAKERLASVEKELEGINKMLVNVGVKDDRFTQLSLITTLRVQKEAELFGERQTIMTLETALIPPATQPAKTFEAVFVVDKPVSPKKGLLLSLGLIGGLLAGVVAVFFVDAWRRTKRERAGRGH